MGETGPRRTSPLEVVSDDILVQRLLVPPDCLESPHINLGPEFKSGYSDMVEMSFLAHTEAMSRLDAAVPFAQRAANPEWAYRLYRHDVPAPSDSYWPKIDALASQAGQIGQGKRLTSFTCVALEQEGKHIEHTLAQFENQTLPPEEYEMFLFLNSYGKDRAAEQRTFDMIKGFQDRHPEIDIRVAMTYLQNEKLSDIKKLGADIMTARWANSPNIDREGYVVVWNDADATYLHPSYLEDYATLFPNDPGADAAVHIHDMDHRAFWALGYDFTFGARVRQVVERQMDHNSGLLFPGGCDTAIRPYIYCAVGGFVPGRPFGVDYTFGKLLHHYRGGPDTVRLVRPGEVGIQTSSRRPAYSHLQGILSGTNTRDNELINHAMRTQEYPYIDTGIPVEAQLQTETRRITDHFRHFGIPDSHPIIGQIFRHFGVETVHGRDGYTITGASAFAAAYERAFRPYIWQ